MGGGGTALNIFKLNHGKDPKEVLNWKLWLAGMKAYPPILDTKAIADMLSFTSLQFWYHGRRAWYRRGSYLWHPRQGQLPEVAEVK